MLFKQTKSARVSKVISENETYSQILPTTVHECHTVTHNRVYIEFK